MTLPLFLVERQHLLAAELDRVAPPADRPPVNVHRSIRYTLLGPSKRVRGVLTLAAAEMFHGGGDALAAATAIEFVHASSLILDDLPAMDDTATRRGRPANHVEFGEATAILAAVGLLNLAFARLAEAYDPALALPLTRLLTEAIGSDGLIGGQAADLQLPAQPLDLSQLEPVHHRKTAVLFRAAALAGALVGGADDRQAACLASFGDMVGLAFQIVDDVLDAEHDARHAGHSSAGNLARPQAAWIANPAEGKRRAAQLADRAVHVLNCFGERADRLRDLTRFLVERTD